MTPRELFERSKKINAEDFELQVVTSYNDDCLIVDDLESRTLINSMDKKIAIVKNKANNNAR